MQEDFFLAHTETELLLEGSMKKRVYSIVTVYVYAYVFIEDNSLHGYCFFKFFQW